MLEGGLLRVLPFVSALLLGIAGCCPTFKLRTACGNFEPKSGLVVLRYRVQKLVSTVSRVRLVSRPICRAPSALLLGSRRNRSKLTGGAPWEAKYAFRNLA